MSWMDSWSRPGKSSTFDPPLYQTHGDEVPYCHSCGRVISTRRSHAHKEVKYCSDRCRAKKPGPQDRKVEAVFVALLDGTTPPVDGLNGSGLASPPEDLTKNLKKSKAKGDHRILVACSVVEEIVFGNRHDPEKTYGRRKNRAPRGVIDKDREWRSVDMESTSSEAESDHTDEDIHSHDDDGNSSDSEDGGVALVNGDHPGTGPNAVYKGAGTIRPKQTQSEVNGSVGGEKGKAEKIEETSEMLLKRREGQRRAEEREMVKKAARRLVAFGALSESPLYEPPPPKAKSRRSKAAKSDIEDEPSGAKQVRKKCEVVINGAVVEPSFAKGDWAIRWREDAVEGS